MRLIFDLTALLSSMEASAGQVDLSDSTVPYAYELAPALPDLSTMNFCVASKPPAAAGDDDDDGYAGRLALAEGTPQDETENVHSLRRSRTSKEPCRTMPIVLAGRLNALATLHLCLYCCAGDCDSDPIMLACPLRIDSAMRCRHCVT